MASNSSNWDVETQQHRGFYEGFCKFLVVCIVATAVTLGLMAIFMT